MTVAVITGASAGLGLEFLRRMPSAFPEIEEYWLIARNEERLAAAAKEISVPCRLLALDLTKDASYAALDAELKACAPDVGVLVNNSGCGFLGNIGDGELEHQTRMVDLNLKGLTAVTHLVLPHMKKGARIINISPIASFCPNARMTTYSASKAYVTAFTFGLSEELRGTGITATAVCSGPMDTEFIRLGGIKGNSKTFDVLPYCDPVKVADGAVRAAKKGRTVYTPRAFYKLYRVLAKILPTKLMMKFAKT